MDNLILSFNVVLPLFLSIALGYALPACTRGAAKEPETAGPDLMKSRRMKEA